MVCHTHAFVDETLKEYLDVHQISDYLRHQLYELECSEFDQVCRAFGQAHKTGSGGFTAVDRGEYSGALRGYRHVHYRNSDWLRINIALSQQRSVNDTMEELIDYAAKSASKGRTDPDEIMEQVIQQHEKPLKKRLSSKATGDWLIYREDPQGKRLYLAIHPHVTRGSAGERKLLSLLKQIEACCYENVRQLD